MGRDASSIRPLMAATVLSVRFDDNVLVLIDRAARSMGKSRSTWAREVLVAAATGGAEIQPHPARALQIQAKSGGEPVAIGCTHPLTARKKEPFRETCGVCGREVKKL